MSEITVANTRVIIKDFAQEISKRKRSGHHPSTHVIKFRQEQSTNYERTIYYVPIELLRYRKDNGRIASDVLNYEKSYGVIDETSTQAQGILEKFLADKDKERTEELYKIIKHEKQKEPAIITCDGFLINGNRRKVVLSRLNKAFPEDPAYGEMKVIILPGEADEGGPPTLLEIEQIENRYQLQTEGKAEYYNFDRALSIRRKIACGMTLKEQLKDDPSYALLDTKEFNSIVKKYEEDFLKPLECIDRYLAHLKRENLYLTISKGVSDPEGRWQAFYDYYNSVRQKLDDNKERLKLGIKEDEIGLIEDVAFKIIRMRDFPDLPKVHKIIRDMPKLLNNPDSKRELLQIRAIDLRVPNTERYDQNGKELSEREIDKKWAILNATKMIKHVKVAVSTLTRQKDLETPIDILEAALKKLNHDELKPDKIAISDYEKVMSIARAIQHRATEIENEFYALNKQSKQKLKSLEGKYRK